METIEKIEMYLEGTLTGTAKAEFELALQQDVELQKEVEEYRDVMQGIRLKGQHDFLKMVHQWERELSAQDVMEEKNAQVYPTRSNAPSEQNVQTTTKTTSVWKLWGRVAAAACVLILLGVGYATFFQKAADPKSVYQEFYTPYNTDLTTRAGSSEFEKAVAAYKSKNYTAAYEGFRNILDTNPDSTIVNLYAGVTEVELGKAAEATTHLQKVMDSENENFTDDAAWYLALNSLKNGDKPNAIIRLEQIRDTPGHSYREKAKAALRKLK